MEKALKDFSEALLEFDSQKAEKILLETIGNNDLSFSVDHLIVESLKDIGDKWANGELALSQIYMSGRICEELVDKVLKQDGDSNKVVSEIGIVTLGDYHVLGKKIVKSIISASGIAVIDFGHGLDVDELCAKVIENKIKILLISTLMLPSALLIKDVRDSLNKINYQVKILVGGSPFIFDKKLYKEVGADAMGISPTDAIETINNWKNS